MQHTYGIPAAMPAISAWADLAGVTVIEDCCHTFGTRVDGRLCGTFGAFAFMSGQWNKPFSTGLGGMLLVRDTALAKRVDELLQSEARRPGFLRTLCFAPDSCLSCTRPAGNSRPHHRTLPHVESLGHRHRQFLAGRATRSDAGRLFDHDGPLPGSPRTPRVGPHRGKHRAPHATDGLLPARVAASRLRGGAGMRRRRWPLLRYPVRVANKRELLALAAEARVEIGSWFEIPLHPEGTHMADFGYQVGMCPRRGGLCGGRQSSDASEGDAGDRRADA